jgi:hypothetical protein
VRQPKLPGPAVRVLAVPLLLAGAAWAFPAAATGVRPPAAASFTVSGALYGVAATSAGNAWAVGTAGERALIVRWDGKAWAVVPSPSPAGSALNAVAAVSAGNAWAVGTAGGRALIMRWDGKAWAVVPSPSPAGSALSAVAAASAGSAWAVGVTGDPGGSCPGCKALIMQWNGKAWAVVAGKSPAGSALNGVAAASAGSAWAVGVTGTKTLILHWNGTAWT